jgi:membrane associated rhomboid family serine protease
MNTLTRRSPREVAGLPPSTRRSIRAEDRRAGLSLLAAIVAVMWVVEIINSLDGDALSHDGIYARNVDRLWGIFTSPFIHASFTHLFDNTIPFVFLGAIIALRGAARLAFITGFVIVLGGLGTWLISPSTATIGGLTVHPDTIGASGVVFGYAGYLLARGFFDRRVLELLIGAIVAVIWGAALLSSLVPQHGISWQAHLCGGIAGVLAAWILSARDGRRRRARGRGAGKPAAAPVTL